MRAQSTVHDKWRASEDDAELCRSLLKETEQRLVDAESEAATLQDKTRKSFEENARFRTELEAAKEKNEQLVLAAEDAATASERRNRTLARMLKETQSLRRKEHAAAQKAVSRGRWGGALAESATRSHSPPFTVLAARSPQSGAEALQGSDGAPCG